MKKFVALLLTVALLTPLCALAEDVETAAVSNVTANAVAESENVYKITAPYSGVLLPFDLESGDPVSKGDTLFALSTGDKECDFMRLSVLATEAVARAIANAGYLARERRA